MYDFITIGGAVCDVYFDIAKGKIINNKEDILEQKLFCFEYGAKYNIDKSIITFGGGAANIAVALSRLGFKAAIIAAIGDDQFSKNILENFKKEKVETAYCQKIKNEKSGMSLIITLPRTKDRIIFSARNSNDYLMIKSKQLTALKKAKSIYLTSLTCKKWQDIFNKVFNIRKEIFWNPGHMQLHFGIDKLKKYLVKTKVFIVNQDEAIELIVSNNPNFKNHKNKNLTNIKNLLKIIKKYGPGIVVITSGKKGVDVYDGIKFYHSNIKKEKKLVDVAGVGDAFGASFAAGLKIYNNNIKKAMELGVKNTALVVAHRGAQQGLLKL